MKREHQLISPVEIINFAKNTLQDQQLRTIMEAKAFTIEVKDERLYRRRSKKKPTAIGDKEIKRVCKRFNETKCLMPGDYKDDSGNASYILPLIVLYLASMLIKHNGTE